MQLLNWRSGINVSIELAQLTYARQFFRTASTAAFDLKTLPP